MSGLFELVADTRTDEGKGASRRLRRLQNKVPGIVYGGGTDPVSIMFEQKDLVKSLDNEAFFSHILTLNLDGTAEQVVVKDVQRHPAKNNPMHIDLLRVNANDAITMTVPLHFINEEACIGVKKQGGVISHQIIDVEVTCLPGDLPEYLEIDMSAIEVGDSVHLSDIKLPSGVELANAIEDEDHDLSIANVVTPKTVSDEESVEGESEGGEASSDSEDGA